MLRRLDLYGCGNRRHSMHVGVQSLTPLQMLMHTDRHTCTWGPPGTDWSGLSRASKHQLMHQHNYSSGRWWELQRGPRLRWWECGDVGTTILNDGRLLAAENELLRKEGQGTNKLDFGIKANTVLVSSKSIFFQITYICVCSIFYEQFVDWWRLVFVLKSNCHRCQWHAVFQLLH